MVSSTHDTPAAHAPMETGRDVYIFDFDGTITTKDTFALFLKYYAGHARWALNIIRLLPVFIGYVINIVSRDSVKAHVIKRFFRNEPESRVDERAARFANDVIPALIRPKALEALKMRLEMAPESLYICSASIGPYLRHWGAKHGITQIMATELDARHGTCTGEILGWNIWGPGKTKRIFAEFSGQNVHIKEAYGDSRGDLEMLNAAEVSFWHPFRL